jgi:hypothetical protein
MTLLLLLFPDGRLPSRRWRWVAPLTGASVGYLVLVQIAQPTLYVGGLEVSNPLPFWARIYAVVPAATVEWIGILAWHATLLSLVAAGTTPALRWRRASGHERQQLKWLAYMASLIAVSGLGVIVTGYSVGWWTYPMALVAIIGIAGFLVGLPMVIAVAIFRYHLYDIDLIIRRTLIYGVLTAALAVVYFGSVVLLQGLLRPLTGQGSDLAIIASTLAIAALFNPLRRRIQNFIDRRFYRRTYDAAQVLAALSSRLRDETDIDTLADEVLTVVQETMQPTHVSLWLRPATWGTKPLDESK